MSNALRGTGMIVVAGQGSDPDRDYWLVVGPYREADGDEGAIDAFSSLIEGEAEAREHAMDLVSELPGCKVLICPRDLPAEILQGG